MAARILAQLEHLGPILLAWINFNPSMDNDMPYRMCDELLILSQTYTVITLEFGVDK